MGEYSLKLLVMVVVVMSKGGRVSESELAIGQLNQKKVVTFGSGAFR
jgi:hypothetical protein